MKQALKQTAKLFANGRSQAVRLPVKFRFEGSEGFIEKDPQTGKVILSGKSDTPLEDFLALRDQTQIPDEFMADRGDGPPQERKLF